LETTPQPSKNNTAGNDFPSFKSSARSQQLAARSSLKDWKHSILNLQMNNTLGENFPSLKRPARSSQPEARSFLTRPANLIAIPGIQKKFQRAGNAGPATCILPLKTLCT
jgi:hypothetical protein